MNDDFIEIIPKDQNSVNDLFEGCKTQNLEYALILGATADGGFFIAASDPDPIRGMFMADKFRNYVMNGG